MEDLGFTEKLHNFNFKLNNILYIQYAIIAIILVLGCVWCKNFKIDNTRRFRGKVVSFV